MSTTIQEIRKRNIAAGGKWFVNSDPDPNIRILQAVFEGPGGTYFVSDEKGTPAAGYHVWKVTADGDISPAYEPCEGAVSGIPWLYGALDQALDAAELLAAKEATP